MSHEDQLVEAGIRLIERQAAVKNFVKAIVVPLLILQLSVMRVIAV